MINWYSRSAVMAVLACVAALSVSGPLLAEGGIPHTHRPFDAAPDKFSFAVFSDLTGGEREGVFELAVAQLNLLRPEFILSVGDLVEGSDERAELDAQWDSFFERANDARAPVYLVGGNHDLLGVTHRAGWEERLGRRYYHFVYKDVLFLALDTDDFDAAALQEQTDMRREAYEVAANEGWAAFGKTPYATQAASAAGNLTEAQSAYMLEAIADNPDVRHTFILAHKAPWLREDLEAFSAIEDALADRPYTVFHGHKHGYKPQKRLGRDYIQLGTTGGVFLPNNGLAMDHVVWVTVDGEGVDIAVLKLSGILDRTGALPPGGEGLCLEHGDCPPGE